MRFGDGEKRDLIGRTPGTRSSHIHSLAHTRKILGQFSGPGSHCADSSTRTVYSSFAGIAGRLRAVELCVSLLLGLPVLAKCYSTAARWATIYRPFRALGGNGILLNHFPRGFLAAIRRAR